LFPDLFSKPILANFDQPDSSSDGGAILLKAINSELNLTERLAGCIREIREEGKIVHPLLDLLRQRVYESHADTPTVMMRTAWLMIPFKSCC